MQTNDERSPDQARFHAICAGLDEWEPLPEPDAVPVTGEEEDLEQEQQAALDHQILAGLVMPV
jgi:hypothetical protein